MKTPAYPKPESLDHLIRILSSFTNYEKNGAFHKGRVRLDLKKMARLCRAAGDPHVGIPSVHITGSKGKGSTAILCAALLESQGLKTGLFTSPHLESVQERIMVNGAPLGEDAFLVLADQTLDLLRRDNGLKPTFFEFLTLMAMAAFKALGVEAAVYEVGLGGRLDATNVLRPLVTVITNVEREHCAILGDREDRIAWEKAGIVKRRTPLITAVPLTSLARPPIEEKARRTGAPFLGPGRGLDVFVSAGEAWIEIEGERSGPYAVPPPIAINRWNAVLALAAAKRLVTAGGRVWQDQKAAHAFHRVRLPGRFEVLAKRPWIVVDGAHTPASIRSILEEARALGPRPPRVILGVAEDKEVETILSLVAPVAGRLIFTSYAGGRAADPERLRALCGGVAETAASPAEALDRILGGLGEEDVLLITGSFYLAGEARLLLRSRGILIPSPRDGTAIYAF